MGSSIEIASILLKSLVVGIFNDQWLYGLHRFFHADPKDIRDGFKTVHRHLRKYHMVHHRGRYKLKLHPVEWMLALVPVWIFGLPLIGWKLGLLYTTWGIFEAARGHGHFLRIPWLPKRFYSVVGYAEVRYHVWHHRHEKENLGQFLWYCDWLYGTMSPRWRYGKYRPKSTVRVDAAVLGSRG